MLISLSKAPSSSIAPYKSTLLSPLLLALDIHLHRGRASQSIRQYNTSATRCFQTSEHAETQESPVQSTLVKAASLALSEKRREPQAWVALVNEFLPRSLRSTHNAEGDETAEDTKFLPALLSKARSTTPLKFDVLGYMGVTEGRWDALRWLFQSLSREYQTIAKKKEHKKEEGFVPWSVAEPNPYGVTSLDEIVDIPINFDVTAVQSAGASNCPKEIRLGFDSEVSRPEWLGQIWAMLAFMILNAAEFPPNHTNGQKIMPFVLETLAHLHHIDAVPRTTYTYHETSDANGSRKPPTLALMADHIMSVLSDSAWKAQDEKIRAEGEAMGARNWYKGHEMPEPTIQPRIENLGKGIWLDLILWCCVEGGYYTEAAWAVAQISKRKHAQQWRVIGWSEIRLPEKPEMNWSVRAELEIARSYMSRIGSAFAIAGPRELPPLVDMGPRTVSREVILTLIDGLASSLRPVAEIEPQIACCRGLLSQKRSLTSETNILNKAVLSIFASRNADTEEAPEAADRVLALTPICDSSSKSKILEKAHDNEVPAALLGLLSRTLYSHTKKGNVQAALRTFLNIQKIIDTDRQRQIIKFAEDLNGAQRTGDEDQLASESINNIIPNVYPQIPVHILSAFLNLLTDAHLYDLGNWLLYSDEVDGPFIPPSLYSELNLQSALLRFATATRNGELFTHVSEKLQLPLATDILRTILQCQITLCNWDAAENIFGKLRRRPALGWQDVDIMLVARSILRLEKDKKSQRGSQARARALLQQLLNGKFSLTRSRSKPWTVTHQRMLNQVYLMLRTIPTILRRLKKPRFTKTHGTRPPIRVSSQAFDILLEGIVETEGSLAGLKFWKRWCRPAVSGPGMHDRLNIQDDWNELDKTVKPTIQSLRVLARPLIRQTTPRSSDEKLLVQWVWKRYREYGLTNSQVTWELPGLFRDVELDDRVLLHNKYYRVTKSSESRDRPIRSKLKSRFAMKRVVL